MTDAFNDDMNPSPSMGRRRALLVAAALLTTSACVSTEHVSRDWSTYDGPGAQYFQAEEVDFPYVEDPLEPINRVTAKFNYEALRWVVRPVASVYRFFIPRPVRTHVGKAATNLRFPTRFLNNALQGKLKETGVELSRFVVNSTVGLLGLFDPAQGWGLHPYPEDFGQTFATWGWKPSTYLMLPFLGPSTMRDALGEIPDAFSDPASYYFPAAQGRTFNALSSSIESDLRTVRSVYDAYEPGRTLYTMQRELDVDDFEWHEDESGPTQTLSAVFLAPLDPGFAGRSRSKEVRIDAAHPRFPYSLWLQPDPAPLMYVLPGFGGNRLGAAPLALAEMAYEAGHSVVVVSSTTNWEFMRNGASVTVPGFGPVDARDTHMALSAIDRQLEERMPGRFQERRICGMSLGAYQALLIAADASRNVEGEEENGRLQFDLFLALNPPVSIEHALMQLDRFYNAPLVFPPEERAERIEEIFAKVLYLSNGELEPGMELPFTETEAQFLIGVAFRLDLQFLILQSQDLHDSGVLLTKRSRLHMAPAFREASEYSYMEYVYAFLLPYFAERDPDIGFDERGAERLFELSDLHAVEDALASHPDVRVFTNENDFLLRPEDTTWLSETLGERLTLFESGGHLGNLYREYLRAAIDATIQPETETAPTP